MSLVINIYFAEEHDVFIGSEVGQWEAPGMRQVLQHLDASEYLGLPQKSCCLLLGAF